MIRQFRSAFVLLGLFTVMTGLVYPLAITAVAQLAAPGQANGSLVVRNGKTVGSVLIGQRFSAIGSFAHHLDAWLRLQDEPEAGPHHGLVINQEHANTHTGPGLSGR